MSFLAVFVAINSILSAFPAYAKAHSDVPEQYRKDTAAAIQAYKQRRFQEAVRLFQDSLKVLEGKEGLDQQRVEALMNLALVYEKQGNRPESCQAVFRAVESTRRQYGKDSGRLPPLLDKLSDLTSDPIKRRELLGESLRIRESLVGKNDASLVRTLHRLSGEQSEPELTRTRRRVWELKKRLPDFRRNNNAPRMAFDLAQGYLGQKDYEQSMKFATEGALLAQELYGKNNPVEFMCRIAFLVAKRESGQLGGGDEIGACIDRARTIVPEDDRYAGSLVSACSLLSATDDRRHAAQVAELMLKSVNRIPYLSAERVLQVEMQAAMVFWANGQAEDAREAIRAYGADIYRRIDGKEKQARIVEEARRQLKQSNHAALAAILK